MVELENREKLRKCSMERFLFPKLLFYFMEDPLPQTIKNFIFA